MNDRNIMRAPSATKSTILNSMAYPSCLRPSTPGFPKSSSSAGGHTASTAIIPSHKRFDTNRCSPWIPMSQFLAGSKRENRTCDSA